jgi:hypothetical protein
LYLHDSRLFLSSGEIILSKQGVRQGCPLSPLLFSLAIDKVLKEENKMAREYGAQVVAYLDDHTFIQTKTKAKKELTLEKIQKRIQPLLTELNLELNKGKCYIFEPESIPASWYPQQDIENEQVENNQQQQKKASKQKSNKKGQKKERNEDDKTESESEVETEKEEDSHTMTIEELENNSNANKDKEINRPGKDKGKNPTVIPANNQSSGTLSRDGVVLLGIPVGTDDFIKQFVNKTLQPKIQAMYRLPEFPTQIAYHMLRLVIVPSTNFLVRALGHIPEYFMKWDDRIKMTVFTLANQIHDYISYEGAAKEQWDDDTVKKIY